MQWAKKQTGFTIVELLIVVVVIAILAAITIVAYNGITQRSKDSAMKAMLSQQAKRLALWKVDNADLYPSDIATAQAAGMLKDDSSVTYSRYIASPDLKNYCATGRRTDGTVLSVTSVSSEPMAGECVTNLVQDPRSTAVRSSPVVGFGNTRWFGASPATGAYTLITGAGDGPLGISTYMRKQWTVSPANVASQGDTGFWLGPGGTLGFPVTTGDSYVFSAYLRASTPKTGSASVYQYDGAGAGLARSYGPSHAVVANTWVRQVYSYTAAAGVSYASYSPDINNSGNNGATVWAPGDTLDGTAAMITKGLSVYAYGDGNSLGWFWNGTPNASTSTGPAVVQ